MDEKMKNNAPQAIESELNYNEDVIAKIVGRTMTTIPGVLTVEGNVIENLADRFRDNDDPTKGVKVDLDDDAQTATLELSATLEYGRNAPKIFDEAVNKVQAEVTRMTDVKLTSFKMTVTDMLTKEEWQAQQDKASQNKSE
ncbi:Asp23/Gls24 family envelope stress response protein [Loigolactobacillus coryniformis]|jgi:uncharacterized alkaline shock family protein YloU|uniref:Stress response regulator gls24 homolog n=2 Tax=Loigolactobacillus coryniformis TaxID=1610 RepID=J2ZUG1_9LACO|nr:Asp23/Gls24 family envelope stress response protein [Loigolactobacillus coryniformis]MDN5945682.1 Asp23/Gls24 family envelope stress response protein [Lactiplantibacillus plantarum]MDT3391964.1 Asp23/Gls24 family envelope stress response protein [Bacillota bacterium]ATO42921.1 general stress protein [Loigolactobacillus coryniformis subsp. torquens DSM 20004 = KCTC 3535]EJN56631.1 Hypothetical protein A11Y_140136 [Loigolactobacillus coryniformis subsp. coryniformis CECT 5711]KRK74105.1 gener